MNRRTLMRLFIRWRTRIWPRINVRLAPKCQKCGYSLAGLAGQGVERCPECGAELRQHEFVGLYRIRGRAAWLVSACGPLIVASVSLLALVHADAAARFGAVSSRLVAYSSLMLTGAMSAAMVLAMARIDSRGRPLLIRGANWNGALTSIAVLGVLLTVMMIAVTAGSTERP